MDLEKHTISPIKEENCDSKSNCIDESQTRKNKLSAGKGTREKKSERKVSLIPRLKTDWNETKAKNRTPSNTLSKVSGSASFYTTTESEKKLQMLDAKEQRIAEYYNRIEEIMRTSDVVKKQKSFRKKNACVTSARKMTSDTFVVNKERNKSTGIVDFENNIRQISNIWLRTSSQLSNTLNTLKKNPGVDPMEFEVESVRIQLAIKQAKSLTLVKTRNVIAEAKKLLERREIIRSELEKILANENANENENEFENENENEKVNKEEKEKEIESVKNEKKNEPVLSKILKTGNKKEKANGKGDSTKKRKDTFVRSPNKSQEVKLVEAQLSTGLSTGIEENSTKEITKHHSDDSVTILKLKKQLKDEFTKNDALKNLNSPIKTSPSKDSSNLKELQRKNTTIVNLYNKVFELQRACNEHSVTKAQLQLKLSELQEKIQWNQLLWKQLGKLKEKIKNLQKNNKILEEQKFELERKIKKLDIELSRLIELNHLLNEKKFLLNSSDKFDLSSDSGSEKEFKTSEKGKDFQISVEKILAEKQTVVEQLKTMLQLMKEQENESQKQILVFQNKIQELENKTKTI